MASRSAYPHVTTVIPTRHAPPSLKIAVLSALQQVGVPTTVVVVSDGPDPSTIRAILRGLYTDLHQRLVILGPSEVHGGNAARNRGIAHAETEWIALLDDDDYWFPDKLLSQFSAVTLSDPNPVVSHQFLYRSRSRDRLLPQQGPPENGNLSEYLFCRRRFLEGRGHLQTSTLLIPTALARSIPFDERLRRHQDHDWLLRLASDGQRIVFVTRALSVYFGYRPESSPSGPVSRSGSWRERAEWASERHSLMTDYAYSGFLLGYCLPVAVQESDWNGARWLLREAYENGRVRHQDLVGIVPMLRALCRQRDLGRRR